MLRAGFCMPLVAGLLALAPARTSPKDEPGDPRAGCVEVAAFLQDVLPAWVRRGDVVIREPIGVPMDISAPAGDGRRLTPNSVLWKSFFAPDAAPSPELVSNWLAVQKYSATECAGDLLARQRTKTRARSWGHNPKDRVVAIGYPGFDPSR